MTPDLGYKKNIISIQNQRTSHVSIWNHLLIFLLNCISPSLFVLSMGLQSRTAGAFLTNSAVPDRASLTPTFAQRSLSFSSRCMSSSRLTANDEIRASGFLTPVRVRVLRPRGAAAEQMCGKICYSS